MALPDVSAIDEALMNKLALDPTLRGLVPDGVYWDVAKQGKTQYVIVANAGSDSAPMFQGEAFARYVYMVKAVGFQTGGTIIRDAGARIHELLHRSTLDLAGTGFELMDMHWVPPRVRISQPDPSDAAARWHHRGGHYQVTVAF